MNRGQFVQKWEHHSKSPIIRRTYKIWNGMNARCYLPNATKYVDYGGRGISVCERWRTSFDLFVKDMGLAPEGMSIERMDNEGNYEPLNCIWATKKQQANNTRSNKRITYVGRTMTVTQWAEFLEISVTRLHSRLRLGWPFERAIDPKTYEAPHGGAQKYATGCRCDTCVTEHRNRANARYRKKNPVIKNRSKNYPNKVYDL